CRFTPQRWATSPICNSAMPAPPKRRLPPVVGYRVKPGPDIPRRGICRRMGRKPREGAHRDARVLFLRPRTVAAGLDRPDPAAVLENLRQGRLLALAVTP